MEALEALHISLPVLAFLSCAALLAGFIDSVAGGGGLISLPATLVAGVPPHFALGTGKFMASIGTVAAVLNYARNNAVLWKVCAVGVFFSFIGSMAGAKTALIIDTSLLGKVLLWLLPAAAAVTFIPVKRALTEETPRPLALYVLTPVICLLVGFYDGFYGPATGTIMLLALHFALGIGLIQASGTAKVFNLASNISSLIIFLFHGKVLFAIAVPMAAANILGNFFGSRMAVKGGPKVVRRMLLLSLALLFATLLWRYYYAQ